MKDINRIYIACALTHVPRNSFIKYTDYIHSLSKSIEDNYFCEVKYALKNSDPQLSKLPITDRAVACYQWDRRMVEWANLIISEITFPSIGLGIELQIAQNLNIPVILIYNESTNNKAIPISYTNPDGSFHDLQIGDGYISYMALGLPNIKGIISHNYDVNCVLNYLDKEKLTHK